MVLAWLLMMGSVSKMHLDDLHACKADNMKPKVCRKFDPPKPKKQWW